MSSNVTDASGLPESSRVRRFDSLVPDYGEFGVSLHEQVGTVNQARIAGGVMFYRDCEVPWTLWYDEVVFCHAVSGKYEIEMGGVAQELRPGDVMWLPSGASVIYRCKGEATVFYAVTPVNWLDGLKQPIAD
jgi:ethanolamine utilization protein EutQ (cupin superfamily)